MNKKISAAFIMLVLVQGLHSIEEYYSRLWEVFLPARLISSLVSRNPESGFLMINIGLFIFGLLCWAIRKNYSLARGLIWFWIVMETVNGVGHSIWALSARAYEPGAATAPFLLILAVYLSVQLLRSARPSLDE